MLASLGPNATDEQKEQVAKIAEAVSFFTVLSSYYLDFIIFTLFVLIF